MKLPLVIALTSVFWISFSGQDRLPYPQTIPNWHGSPNGKWVATADIPICAIFTDTGHGLYEHVYGATPPDFVEPKKGFKIGDIQKLGEDDGAIVKIMPRHYRPNDLKAEERLCSEENQLQPPPQDK